MPITNHIIPSNEISLTTSFVTKGMYSAILSSAQTFGDCLNSCSVSVFAVIDMSNPTSEKSWLRILASLYTNYYGSDTIGVPNSPDSRMLVAVILRNGNSNITSPSVYTSYLGSGYDIPGDPQTTNYIPFPVIRTDTYSGSLANSIVTSVDGIIDSPISIVCVNSIDKYLIDKFHLRSTYNGLAAELSNIGDIESISNLIVFDPAFSEAPYNPSTVLDYITSRIQAAMSPQPYISIYPDSTTTFISSSIAKVRSGSRIVLTYSGKPIGNGTKDQSTNEPNKFKFEDTTDNQIYLNLIKNTYGMTFSDLPVATGHPASSYLTDTAEKWICEFDDLSHLDGHVIRFKPMLDSPPGSDTTTPIVDIARREFSLGPSNSDPLVFLVDESPTADISATVNVLIEETIGSETRVTPLQPGSNTVIILQNPCTLICEIKTLFPGYIEPSVFFDSSQSYFDVNALSKNLAVDTYGAHHLHVDAYTNGAGVTVPAADYYFDLVDVSTFANHSDALEGWGYYPREEGAPGACPEALATSSCKAPDGGHVPAWALEGSLAPAVNADGHLAFAKSAGDLGGWYVREYEYSLANAGEALTNGARAYIEARIKIGAPSPATGVAYDASAPATLLDSMGDILSIRNGPYVARLALLRDSGGLWRLGMRVHPAYPDPQPGKIPYLISSFTLPDLDSFRSVRLARLYDGSGSALWRITLLEVAHADFDTAETLLPRVFASEHAGYACASFGMLENIGQSGTLLLDYLRYAFYDAKYEPAAGNALSLGFPDVYRGTDRTDGPFYRSERISLDGHATDEPIYASDTVNLPLAATVRKTASGYNAGMVVNAKLRFLLADWDDSSAASMDGFNQLSTFPAYDGSSLKPLAGISTAAFSVASGASVDATVAGPALLLTVDRARLARRLFVLAYVDYPLAPLPGLYGGAPSSGYFKLDAAGDRVDDARGVVRQFLPDFYVRPTESNTGDPGTSSSLSPDMALAVFRGSSPLSLPDPRGTAESTYPWGFAKGDPVPYAYSPSGVVDIPSSDPAKPIKLTDSGWSDYSATDHYYNRMWMRVSNRGIVPGPARSQMFFLGSVLRADFDPYGTDARDDAYERIWANQACTDYVQTVYQLYDPGVQAKPVLADAIPALSGASTPGAAKNYALAEFVWHVPHDQVPPDASDSHGCRVACVNLRDNGSHPEFTNGLDTSLAVNTADSVWSADHANNNLAVRNANIVQGHAADDGIVSQKMVIEDDSPVNFARMPNDFTLGFSKAHARWGLLADARDADGLVFILRLPLAMCKGVSLKHCAELLPDGRIVGNPGKIPGKHVFLPFEGTRVLDRKPAAALGGKPLPGLEGKPQPGEPVARPKYRFFLFVGGVEATLDGLSAVRAGTRLARAKASALRVFYLALPGTKPGRRTVTLTQTANGKPVGAYRTVVDILARKSVGFVADRRTGAIYDARQNPNVFAAVPHDALVPFTSPDMAVQEGFRLAPADARRYFSGELGGELANGHRSVKPSAFTDVFGGRLGDSAAIVVGRVVNLARPDAVAKLPVVLRIGGADTAVETSTDRRGYYVARVPLALFKSAVSKAGGKAIVLRVSLAADKNAAVTAGIRRPGGIHSAMPTLVIKR